MLRSLRYKKLLSGEEYLPRYGEDALGSWQERGLGRGILGEESGRAWVWRRNVIRRTSSEVHDNIAFYGSIQLALWPSDHVLDTPACFCGLPSIRGPLEVEDLRDELFHRHRP